MKYLLILVLLLPWAVSAECERGHGLYISGMDYISVGKDSICFKSSTSDIHHDTLKEYVKSIAVVCDTILRLRYPCDCDTTIHCHTDTIWGDKIPVYLTPKELDRLMKFIEHKIIGGHLWRRR